MIQRKEPEATLPAVKVTASDGTDADGSAADAYRVKKASIGVLGEKSLKDTPYSIEVYSRELIENKQARSLADLTKGDASISFMLDNLITENNSLAIRGLPTDFYTGLKIDGMNTRARATDLPLEHFERVEILKGASGFLYGFGAPGGVINHVLKRPTDAPRLSLGAQIMDSGLTLLHGDVGGRFGTEEDFGYRINLVGEEGDTYINDGESDRKSASIALDWRITPTLTWQIDSLYADRESYGGYWGIIPNNDGLFNWSAGKPLSPIDGDKRLVPSWLLYESKNETTGTDILWSITDNWNARLSYRSSSSYRYLQSPGIFADSEGNYSLASWNYNNLFESEDLLGSVSGTFDTAFITHELVGGLSHSKTVSSTSADHDQTLALSQLGNLSNPVEFPKTISNLSESDAEYLEYDHVRRQEIFLSDTLHFGDNWDLILGLRHGTLENKYSEYDDSEITPTVAVVMRPLDSLSLYASYVEALEEGLIVTPGSGFANDGEIFPPLTSKQYEIGAKAEGADWSATAAIFRLERALTYVTDNNEMTQNGEARYQGLELSSKLSLSPQTLITASALWLDATNQKVDDELLEGQRIQGVARQQFSLYGEYRLAGLPLTFSAGGRHMSKRPVDGYNQWYVGSVTLFDAGARYETKWNENAVTLRFNIDNLTDEAYWVTQPQSFNLMQGAPRTAKLGVQVDFN